ncbi:hypothetical protein EJ04DRAFT_580970 [Polyplosphaeria fusca]|uniref:Uncharacterized protein n=1 Tax=Polyplosphaeria fusca TaxID=682080 RepID=A0A9P4UY94_9PLEO|nr:hypothetical protein EJ04DRAFT_580970 [Polyplosphaeria fusca]
MAGFGRSNSLSINTSGTLFGSNPNQAQQPSSNAQQPAQPQTAGGLFASSSQPQTGGLFGGQPSQPPQSGPSFAQPQASQPQSGGLFGGVNKPATTGTPGNLFASTTAVPQSQQQGGGLFGGALGANSQSQKPSLFGTSTQQSTTPSLFGNNQAQNPAPGASLFASSTQQNQPQQSSMFGLGQSKPPMTLGPSVAGTDQLNQSALQINAENVKGTSRFSDLNPAIQNDIEALDKTIQHYINDCARVTQSMPKHGETLATVRPDVAYISQFLSTVELGIDTDSTVVAALKHQVVADGEDSMLSFRAIANLSLPAQFHYGNRSTNTSTSSSAFTKSSPSASSAPDIDNVDDPTKPVDMMSYFDRRADDLARTLDVYQRQIREIEAHLRTMEAGTLEKAQQLSGSRSGVRDQRRELVEALKAIEGAIVEAARRVGGTRDVVEGVVMGR